MTRLSAISQYSVFSAMLVCFFFPSVGWSTENGTVAELRERVTVLAQARGKAVAELTVKEQLGAVTNQDQEHYQTVLIFLEQQIADSCTQLIEKGGAAAVIELPCPKSTVAPEKNEEQKSVEKSGEQTSEKHLEEVIPETKQSPPASTQADSHPAPETVKKEKVEKKEVRQQSPETGIVASIRRWFESLFKPKPPPAKSSSEAEPSPEQKESTSTAKENTQQSSESTTQQDEPGAVSNDKDAATSTGSREQSEKSAAKGDLSSEKQAGEQKQAQQELKDGEKSGDEQASEHATEQTAGQKKSASGNSIERGAKDQATAKENTQQSSESTTQQDEPGAVSNDKDSATSTGSREQSEKSAAKGDPSSEKQGGEQKQAQQELKDGDKQTTANGEKSGDEQASEHATEQTAGQKKSTSGNSIEKAAKDQSSQEAEQGQNSNGKSVDNRAAEKAVNQAADGSDQHESRQGNASSETETTETADTGKSTAKQGTHQKDATGQKNPAQSAGQSIVEKETSQPAPVESGSEGKEKTDQVEQADSGSSPGVDAELSRLEASLNAALGEFDGQLLNEQERLAARIPRQREEAAAGSGGYGAQGPPDPAGGYGSPEGEKGDGRAGSGGYEQPGSIAAGGGKPAPTAGSSTIDSDDDIVARQLREAAEKETDPVLKEKLWQEYRKYKQGSG